jgi:hypothetical protein
VLPPTILNHHLAQLTTSTHAARLASGVSISSAKSTIQAPVFIPTTGALLPATTRSGTGSSSLYTSLTPNVVHSNKRKRPTDAYSALPVKQAVSIKPPITVNVSFPKNSLTLNPLIASRSDTNVRPPNRSKKTSSKPITFIPDHTRTPTFKPAAVDIFISSPNSDKPIDLNNRYQNRFQPRADISPNMQVISIPAPVKSSESSGSPSSAIFTSKSSKNVTDVVTISTQQSHNENLLPLHSRDIAMKKCNNSLNITSIHSKTPPPSPDQPSQGDDWIKRSVKKEFESIVISKLDMQEQRMNLRRKQRHSIESGDFDMSQENQEMDWYNQDNGDSDFSDFENIDDYEYWLHYKRILTKGPPLKPVHDDSKVHFLHQVGLISNSERSEMEFNQMIERQRLFDDTEWEVKSEHRDLIRLGKIASQTTCTPTYLEPSKQLPSDFNRKVARNDTIDKRRFFQFLDLKPEPNTDRLVQKEALWNGIVEEKRRRNEFELCFTKILDNLHPSTKRSWLDALNKSKANEKLLKTVSNNKKCMIVKNLKPATNEQHHKSYVFAANTTPPTSVHQTSQFSVAQANSPKISIKRTIPNDFSQISWSGLTDFQKGFQKHLQGKIRSDRKIILALSLFFLSIVNIHFYL